MKYLSTKHERNSAKITALILLILVLLLFVVGPPYKEIPEEYGVAINFGEDGVVNNSNTPSQSEPAQPETVKDETVEEETPEESQELIEPNETTSEEENTSEEINKEEEQKANEEAALTAEQERIAEEEKLAAEELLEKQKKESEIKAAEKAKKEKEAKDKALKALKEKQDAEAKAAKEKAAKITKAKAQAAKEAKEKVARVAAAKKAAEAKKAAAAKKAKNGGGNIVGFNVVENVPVYPGCEGGTNATKLKCMNTKLKEFVNANFDKEIASQIGLKGSQKILINFKISQTGKVVAINPRAADPKLVAEAKRVANLLPRLKPGMQQGKPVIVPYSVSIRFQAKE